MPLDVPPDAGNDEVDLGKIKNRIIGSGEEQLDQIMFNPRNWRIHPLSQQDALKGVLEEVGWVQQVIVNKRTGNLIDGHLRCQLAAREGATTIPVVYVDVSEEEEALVLATLDPIGAMAATDKQKLDELFADIQSENENVRKMMDDIAAKEKLAYGESGNVEQARKTLAERFIVPPFSVLDARQGYWQERKKAWFAVGINGALGRGENVPNGLLGNSEQARSHYGVVYAIGDNKSYANSRRAMDKQSNVTGATKMPDYSDIGMEYIAPGTSIFDPVLCELAYRWWCPAGGLVINPTAGESVYGLVASYLGYRYKGVELREEQVQANRKQNTEMGLSAEWILGDGQDVYSLVGEDADMIMCCPPYADLEVYSDNPLDLSTMEYQEFIEVYRKIISESVKRLKDNRFAVFTVGEIRDARGAYRNFLGETIKAFLDAGCSYYNEATLITPAGTAGIRAGRQFTTGRKLVKSHQNVLVFLKGDWHEAVKACGDVEVSFPNE